MLIALTAMGMELFLSIEGEVCPLQHLTKRTRTLFAPIVYADIHGRATQRMAVKIVTAKSSATMLIET